ncbi:MFS transporter [Nocardia pneumoniae]|uniref:MFS transporter n=1 Tax=Nocardia pneumoniae TaxID=228601 RepID=UPI0003161A72|nr:MFS transporter [Nocardia pneumoniae]
MTPVAAPAIGPTIGGVMLANLGWEWLFLINIPFGLVAFVLGRARICCRFSYDQGPIDSLARLAEAGH